MEGGFSFLAVDKAKKHFLEWVLYFLLFFEQITPLQIIICKIKRDRVASPGDFNLQKILNYDVIPIPSLHLLISPYFYYLTTKILKGEGRENLPLLFFFKKVAFKKEKKIVLYALKNI